MQPEGRHTVYNWSMLTNLTFEIKKYARARAIRITVKTDGRVVVTQPAHVSEEAVHHFVQSKSDWIQKAKAMYAKANFLVIPKASRSEYLKYKREAKLLVLEKLRIWNEYYGSRHQTHFNKVTIRNQTSRWGSCSKHLNLNFSYRIVFLPERFQDYLIVHELCHTKVFNHSRAFWALVEETIPHATIKEFKKRVR